MRFFAILLFLLLSNSVQAQVHPEHMTSVPSAERGLDCTDPDVPFGYYGFYHCSLHKSGTIPALLKKTGEQCCDGGLGGECRGTEIKRVNGADMALIDGMWCPLGNTPVHKDIPFPMNTKAFAVVCASAPYNSQYDPYAGIRIECPAIVYCAAAAPAL